MAKQSVPRGVVDPHRPHGGTTLHAPGRKGIGQGMTAIVHGQAGRLRLRRAECGHCRRHRPPAGQRASANSTARPGPRPRHCRRPPTGRRGCDGPRPAWHIPCGLPRHSWPRPDRPLPAAHAGPRLPSLRRASGRTRPAQSAPPRSTNTVCGELQPCWSNAQASAAMAAAVRRAVPSSARRSAPTIANDNFGPKTMSSVPYRRGRLMIASTASRPPQATRTSARRESSRAAAGPAGRHRPRPWHRSIRGR